MKDNKLIKKFKLALRSDKLKITPQRLSIFNESIKDKGHRDIERILDDLRKSNVKVDTIGTKMCLIYKKTGNPAPLEFFR